MMFRRRNQRVAKFICCVTAGLLLVACGAAGDTDESTDNPTEIGAAAGSDWSIAAGFTDSDGNVSNGEYTPLSAEEVPEGLRVCLVFPALNFPIWTTANYGTLTEAQRVGVEYSVFDAGGYEHLATQVTQMDDCISQDFDAIIAAPITTDGLCPSIERALNASIPVVDIINGTDCDAAIEDHALFAHVGVSYHDAGAVVAEHLLANSGGEERKVAMFVGPEGAGYADDGAAGFSETVEGSDVEVIADIRGTTAVDTQLTLIEDAIKAYPDMTDIYGVDPAAEAAIVAVRNAGRSGEIGIYGYSITPAVFEGIEFGDVEGAVTDYVPFIGRMAVDTALRLVQGEELDYRKVGPIPEIITPDTHGDFSYDDIFSPPDFKSVSNWAPGD